MNHYRKISKKFDIQLWQVITLTVALIGEVIMLLANLDFAIGLAIFVTAWCYGKKHKEEADRKDKENQSLHL